MVRIRAIWYCLFFGLLPWWVYEKECHYKGMTYRRHRWLNLALAARWVRNEQTPEDIEFEREANNNF